jgi:hypothetical protein
VFEQARVNNITSQHSYMWVGSETTFRAIDLSEIPEANVTFEGACFFTPMYGLGSGSALQQAAALTDWQYVRALGGLDPFWVGDLDLDVRSTNPWAYSQALLASDATFFAGYPFQATYANTLTFNFGLATFLYNWIDDLHLYSGSSTNFNPELQRRGFVGVWVQPKREDLSAKKPTADSGPESLPWEIRSAVQRSDMSEPLIELRFQDPRTYEYSTLPEYPSSMALTRRVFVSKDSMDDAAVLFNVSELVPVTHVCEGGCGGGLVNSSESGYLYVHGTCVGPNTCECVARTDAVLRKAFFGDNCDRPLCDVTCGNGECAYNYTTGVTACACQAGWTGPQCNQAICTLYGCSPSHGSCVLPDVCQCNDGWFGRDCAQECLCESGSCNDGNSGTGECTCNEGSWGQYCQFDCTCLNGLCSDGASGSGACTECDDGFFGANCEAVCTCQNGVCDDGVAGSGTCASCDAGWFGADCDVQIAVVAAPAAVGAMLLGYGIFLLFRWYLRVAKHRALLANMDWRVNWDDITMAAQDVEASQKLESMRFHSNMSLANQGKRWNDAERIGRYKGSMVQIDKLRKGAVDLSVAVRKEVRAMRETHHVNLLQFVGASIDAPNVAVLYECCQKGSLDDILSNPDVRLDDTFKYSLLKDVANGMRYVHQSSFKFHGRLCTANCFVDNRWTVKLTGQSCVPCILCLPC